MILPPILTLEIPQNLLEYDKSRYIRGFEPICSHYNTQIHPLGQNFYVSQIQSFWDMFRKTPCIKKRLYFERPNHPSVRPEHHKEIIGELLRKMMKKIGDMRKLQMIRSGGTMYSEAESLRYVGGGAFGTIYQVKLLDSGNTTVRSKQSVTCF